MIFSAPGPVVSGKPYRVRQVLGHDPRHLSDFAGQTDFILNLDGEEYTVMGVGLETDAGAQVFEKDDEGRGKDVRVWAVQQEAAPGSFTAMHCGQWRRPT